MRNPFAAVTIAVCSLWLAACSHPVRQANRPPAPAASPRALARPSSVARASETPGSGLATASSPKASASPAPRAVQSPGVASNQRAAPKVPRLAPNAAPQILQVDVSETTVHPGDTVSGRVVTTSNVASVEARIGGYAMSLDKVGVGRFVLSYTVAALPWFIRGNFTMRVIAKNTRGDTVERAIPLTVR